MPQSFTSSSVFQFCIAKSTENALLCQINISMDFFEKLKSTLSSPLKNFQGNQFSESCAIKTWTLPVDNFGTHHIRLLLYRDCDRRGRKCLYDSHHVIRDKNGKFSYVVAAGANGAEMKNLSEYVFGCVPLSGNCGTKRFHKYDGKYIWSKVFSPKKSHRSSSATLMSPSENLSSSRTGSCGSSPLSQSPLSRADTDEVDGCSNRRIQLVTSLPQMTSASVSSFGKCTSLPAKLHESHPKTLLGLGIMVETTPENRQSLGPYLQAISGTIEECSHWFSIIASNAYSSPSTFVPTLYDFTAHFKNLLFSRLSCDLVLPLSLMPNWRSLPPLTTELTQLILQYDQRHCKLTERLKLVIVGGSKKLSEVAGLLYFFKILLLQCSQSTEIGTDATAFCQESATCKTADKTLINQNPGRNHGFRAKSKFEEPKSFDSSCLSMSSSAAISVSSTALSISSISAPPSPPIPEPPALAQQISFTVTAPKIEDERLQKRDYDSGIELELDCSTANLSGGMKSMRRSVSQKFDSGCRSGSGSSDDNSSSIKGPSRTGRRYSRSSLHPQYSHEFEEVSFHLGDLAVDFEQSINSLALSEPNLDKLRVCHVSPSFIDLVSSNAKIEKMSTTPIPVKIDFETESRVACSKSARPYCPYCDSIGLVSKFSPLYYIQWVQTSSCGLTEEDFNIMKSFSSSRFIVVNLEKSLIQTVNFDPIESFRTMDLPTSCNTNSSSSLVSNLFHNLQQLLGADCSEGEVEHFLQGQLDFIKRIAHEFGESWMSSTIDNSSLKKKYSYLSLSHTDLKLIYSLARMKFPSLVPLD